MKKYFILFIVICGLGYVGYRYWWASSSFLNKKNMVVDGKEHPVLSPKNVKETGLPYRNVLNRDNAAIQYIKAINLYEKPSKRIEEVWDYVHKNRWLPGESDFVRWFESNRDCIKTLKKAIAKKDCQFPVFGNEDEPLYTILLPHLAPFRSLARLLAIEGKKYEHEGKYDKALDNYLALYKMRKDVSKESLLISHLVGIACQGIANNAIEKCLANHNISASTLREFIEEYESAQEGQPKFTDCLVGERLIALDLLRRTVEDPSQFKDFLSMSLIEPGRSKPPLSDDKMYSVARFAAQREEEVRSHINYYYNKLEEWDELPAWEALKPENDPDKFLELIPKWDVISRICLPALRGMRKQYVRITAQSEGIRVVAAIKLYHKENGRYPARLQELSKYLERHPTDPYSGRLFRYRASSHGWILYSVGENLVDDGGMGSYPHKWKTDKDIVFRSGPIKYRPFRR